MRPDFVTNTYTNADSPQLTAFVSYNKDDLEDTHLSGEVRGLDNKVYEIKYCGTNCQVWVEESQDDWVDNPDSQPVNPGNRLLTDADRYWIARKFYLTILTSVIF